MRIKSAKEAIRKPRSGYYNAEHGVYQYHCFEERKLTQWEDTRFKFGSQDVTVFFTHPRYEFYEGIDHAAYEIASERFPLRSDPFGFSKKNYARVGNSRKKVTSYTCNPIGNGDFYKCWEETRKEMFQTTSYSVGCSFDVIQYDYARCVNITIPMELLSIQDLVKLKEYVISVLKGERNFKEDWKEYFYDREDFFKDYPEGR